MQNLSVGRRFRIALVGYGVSLVFGLAFFAFRGLKGLSPTEHLLLAAAGALPLLLAVIWERLSGLKIGEFEISLVEVTQKIDIELANAIQDTRGSYTPQLVQLIKAAIQKSDLELVEVNLRSVPYWWSTRIYLLAALAEEYTAVQRLVFVEGGASRFYVGMASPHAVRKAFAARFPAVETSFQEILARTRLGGGDKVMEVESIGYQWEALLFQVTEPELKTVREEEFRKLVSASTLGDWLASSLETESREWDGSPPGESVYARILTCETSFVPLIGCGRRLETVVNRHNLANKIALSVLKS